MNNFSHGIDRLLWGFIVLGATILIVLDPSLEQGFFPSGTVNPQISVFGVKCFGTTSTYFILFKNYTFEKFTANIIYIYAFSNVSNNYAKFIAL